MSSLYRFLHVPSLVRTFIRNVNHQKQFLKIHLGPELDEARKNSDGSLDESDFKKINSYYGLAVPAILGEEIAALRGRPMTERERLSLSYQGAMTGLFDDFFDKHGMPGEKLQAFIRDPTGMKGKNSAETLFLALFRKALEYAHDPGLTVHYLGKVHEAQLESLRQAVPGLSRQEITNITIDKGGQSVLFYRSSMDHPQEKEEETALYKIGGLMQFGNDIFDVHKDAPQGIETLMTTTQNVDDVRNMFRAMQNDSFSSFYKTPYPARNIRRFLRMVSLSLCARCYVCLDQLEKLEKKTGGLFRPQHYKRSELICDLDTAANKWRSIRYHVKQDTSTGA